VSAIGVGKNFSRPPQGIREEVAALEGRIRQAISTWPLAPLSASLSGYREIYDKSWRTPLQSALRRTSCIARPCAPYPLPGIP
jgi:hypothetical protein